MTEKELIIPKRGKHKQTKGHMQGAAQEDNFS